MSNPEARRRSLLARIQTHFYDSLLKRRNYRDNLQDYNENSNERKRLVDVIIRTEELASALGSAWYTIDPESAEKNKVKDKASERTYPVLKGGVMNVEGRNNE